MVDDNRVAALEAAPKASLPSGTVAFLFTDIAGSTRMLEALGSDAYAGVLADHRRILRDAFAKWHGTEMGTEGDSFFVVFERASDAVHGALDAQLGLAGHDWPASQPVRVRMSVHAGEVLSRGGEYVGMEVHRGARIMAAGYGGQILLSEAAAALVGSQLPDDARLVDLGEQSFKDLPRPERVFQLTHAGLQETFPPLKTAVTRTNLPAQASAFIGREAQLREVGDLLEDPQVRLVTLTGPGGTGKTRLALRLAEIHGPRYADGAFFVDLASAYESNAALAMIVQALGLTLPKEQSATELLKQRLGPARTLLLLDNFEQVTAAASAIAELLEACPGLNILVTSREALRIRGERVYPVSAMTLPPAGEPIGNVNAFEAIQLFVERARAVNPAFRMTDDNASAIVEICRRLDGLPLAIELATARLKLFSAENLRDRLNRSLEVLKGGARDLPERQQTIHATIDWSYQLLEPGEQQLFEILAVFPTATYAAIEDVVSATDASTHEIVDVLEGIGSLIDKSLIRGVSTGEEPRVGMLQTIRAFASERLGQRPGLDAAARRAHADHFAAMAGHADAESPPTDEIENLEAAWRYGVEQGDVALLEAMNSGLWRAREAIGLYRATIQQATDLLALLEAAPATPERGAQRAALGLRRLRSMLVVLGYTREVEEAALETIDSFEADQIGGDELFPALRLLGGLYELRTEFDKSEEIVDRILKLADERDDGEMRASAHLILAAADSFRGDPKGADAHFNEALAWYVAHPPTIRGRLANVHGAVAAHNASALNLQLLGLPDQAAERAARGIELAERLGDPHSLAYAHYHTGFLYLWRQEPERVLNHAGGVVGAVGTRDLAMWLSLAHVLTGAAKAALGQVDEGLAEMDSALGSYRGLRTPPIFWPFLQLIQVEAYARAGRFDEAMAILEEAAATPGYGALPQIGIARGGLMLAARGTEAVDEAAAQFRTAYETSVAAAMPLTQLQAAVALRGMGRQLGTDDGAAELRSTYDQFTEGFDTPDLVAARELLE